MIGVPVQKQLLTIYLSDHLAGATGAVQRLSRMYSQYTDLDMHAELVTLTSQIMQDRTVLLDIIERVGVRPQRLKLVAGRFGEVLGRLKRNGRVWSRSPLTPLVEIEAIHAGVAAKLSLWQSLGAHADTLGLGVDDLADLQDRARTQLLVLEQCHAGLAPGAFTD